jgi:hypothetical protein
LVTMAPLGAQKARPAASVDIAADAVLRDAVGDHLRSDGITSRACEGEASVSRYCGGAHATYPGLGPECSRISYASTSGDYSFRTQSSRCEVDPANPPTLRSAIIDLSAFVPGSTPRCDDTVAENDVITRTVVDPEENESDTRHLNVCGANLVPDVRIEASGLFARTTAAVIVPFSLHEPPIANTTQFVLEFAASLPVTGTTGRPTLTSTGQTARLYEVTPGKGGKPIKTYVGEYTITFSLTAAPVP